MEKQKKEKHTMQTSGVTLIALIMTIIILLILAVTSVVLVMRWNMLDKTEYATEGYQGASERDILEVAFGEYAMDKTTGNESADFSVGEEYENEGITVVEKKDKEDKKTGWKVTFSSGNEYAVDEDGMIRRTSTGPLGEAVGTEDYGKQVNFKSKGESLEDLIWRIFYKDSKNVYLISETQDKNYPIPSLPFYTNNSGTYTKKPIVEKYSNGADVSRQGQDLMMIAKQHNDVFTKDNTNENIIATAYLCDITKWEDYLDKEGKAAWAMGGPTMELFVKSYDATQKKETGAETKLEISNKGYKLVLSAQDTFKTSMNHGIYRLKETGSWWQASPRDFGSSNGCIVCDVSDVTGSLNQRLGDLQSWRASDNLYSSRKFQWL